MIPTYWIEFLDDNDLRGVECEITEDADLSQIGGGRLLIYSENDIHDEASNYYPGLVVKQDGYVPVSSCSEGSGDPYFINSNDGRSGPLYRIYHDYVHDESYDRTGAVKIVLAKFTSLLSFRVP